MQSTTYIRKRLNTLLTIENNVLDTNDVGLMINDFNSQIIFKKMFWNSYKYNTKFINDLILKIVIDNTP